MKEEYKNEIIKYIKDNNMQDVFTEENLFFQKYNCNLWTYLRVSTENQDFFRQVEELYKYAKKKNITIFIDNIYFDKYTGKKLNRKGYIELRQNYQPNDYLLITNLNRLGRNWDGVRLEWYHLKSIDVNVLISDPSTSEFLSSPLPEEPLEVTLNRKYFQELIFINTLYKDCLKIEEVKESTINGLKKARKKGKELGRPKGKYTTKENFKNTLNLVINENYSLAAALRKTRFPKATYFDWLNEFKDRNNTNDNNKILELLEKGEV